MLEAGIEWEELWNKGSYVGLELARTLAKFLCPPTHCSCSCLWHLPPVRVCCDFGVTIVLCTALDLLSDCPGRLPGRGENVWMNEWRMRSLIFCPSPATDLPELRRKPVPLASMLLSFPAWTMVLIKKTRVTWNIPCVWRKLFKFLGFAVPLEASSSSNVGEYGGFLLLLTVLFPSWLRESCAHPPVCPCQRQALCVPSQAIVSELTMYSLHTTLVSKDGSKGRGEGGEYLCVCG